MSILFISSFVPDLPKYRNNAFTRSGNNVALGIIKGLKSDNNVTFLSFRPIPSFPNGPIWIGGETISLESGEIIKILPTLNIKIIKNIVCNIIAVFSILKWAYKERKSTRNILVYNIYVPAISSLYKVSRITKSKLFAILYDLGIPPKRLGLGKLTMLAYKIAEKKAKKYIPKLDGRIVINEKIIDYYAPTADYILIDGGINEQIISNLSNLKKSKNKYLKFVLAGMLWDQNGTKLVLDTLKQNPDLEIEIYFAGQGIDVPLIEEHSKQDKRIKYLGLLNMEDLFNLYNDADVLLNLRIEEEEDFHFPSKLLEYMVTGKQVISTPIAHAEKIYGEYLNILHDITSEGLANVIKQLINNSREELLKKGIQTRNFMLTERNWDIQTKRIENYMQSKH